MRYMGNECIVLLANKYAVCGLCCDNNAFVGSYKVDYACFMRHNLEVAHVDSVDMRKIDMIMIIIKTRRNANYMKIK